MVSTSPAYILDHSHEAQTCPTGGCLWSWAVHLMELPNRCNSTLLHWKLVGVTDFMKFPILPKSSQIHVCSNKFNKCRFFGWLFSDVFPSMVPPLNWRVSIIFWSTHCLHRPGCSPLAGCPGTDAAVHDQDTWRRMTRKTSSYLQLPACVNEYIYIWIDRTSGIYLYTPME